MKKSLTGLALAATMVCGSTVTTFAADTNPAGGNTDVYVGVVTEAPKSISVTVPTSLAIAVVANGGKVDTLMGNYMVDKDGNVTNSGDNSAGIKAQRVTFINTGTVNAKIVSAKIINPYGSRWAIKDTPAKGEMSMKFNDKAIGDIVADQNKTVILDDFELKANTITHMPAEVKVGGVASDYPAIEKSAKAFVIEWNIGAK